MHLYKAIHLEREFGVNRLAILQITIFITIFCFSFVLMSFNYSEAFTDQYLNYFVLSLLFIYPIHKLLHYYALLRYRKTTTIKFKLRHYYMPVIVMRLKEFIPRKHYIFALLAPFIFINIPLLICGIIWPMYAHYFSIYLGIHCSICLIDLIYVKILINAPKNAIIEETPKGYEILVPITD